MCEAPKCRALQCRGALHQREGPAVLRGLASEGGPCSAEGPTARLGGHQRHGASPCLMSSCIHDPEGDEALLC